MKKQLEKEMHVLNRIMFMLEEGSVSHLATEDNNFGQFIASIYGTIDKKAATLQQKLV